jgi:hypothetical protein
MKKNFPTALALLIIMFYISASTMQCTKVIPKNKTRTIVLPETIRLEPQSHLLLVIDRVTPDSIIIDYAHLDTLKCPE